MSEQNPVIEGYDHFLYYDDPYAVVSALQYVRKTFDSSVELVSEASGELVLTTGYAHAVVFTTDEEFTKEQAEALFQVVLPDAYDLNIASGDENDDEEDEDDDTEEDQFPAVFTETERDLAVAYMEDELTLEYIRRLERIAYTAYVFYVKSCNLAVTLPDHGIAALPVEKLAEALHEELTTVDFMR